MNENNIFIVSEKANDPGNSNTEKVVNCNGHNTSIEAGGNGHKDKDGCDCDSMLPSVSVSMYIPFLIAIAVIIIFKGCLSQKILKP